MDIKILAFLFQQRNRKYKVFLELNKTQVEIIQLENTNINVMY